MSQAPQPGGPGPRLVRARGLTRRVPTLGGALKILEGIDLEIRAGERICLIGPNGTGKSTLLRILAGLDRELEGELEVDTAEGEPFLLLQESDLFPWLTVKDNLLLGRGRSKLSPSAYVGAMNAGLADLGLADLAERRPGQLSGGQRQQISLLRASLSGTPLLLLDEPFSRLDPGTRATLRARTLSLWEEHRPALLLVTHDLEEAISMGERLWLLDRSGRLRELPHPAPGSGGDATRSEPDPVRREIQEAFLQARAPGPDLAGGQTTGRGDPVAWLSPLLLLLAWQGIAAQGWIDVRFFPPPSEALAALWELLRSGALWGHLGASLWRWIAGVGAGTLLGAGAGLGMALLPQARRWLEPILAVAWPIPKVSILPLLWLLLGLGDAPKIALIGLGAFFLVLLSCLHGGLEVVQATRAVVENLRLRGWDRAGRAVLYGSMPAFFTGLRTATGYGLVLLVVAERDATERGIGALVWGSWQLLEVGQMYGALMILAALGWLSMAGVNHLERIWTGPREGGRSREEPLGL